MTPAHDPEIGPGARSGEVIEFDDPAGYGTVQVSGGAEHFFHCSAIADGTRKIEVGAKVSFFVEAGAMGRWEAKNINPA